MLTIVLRIAVAVLLVGHGIGHVVGFLGSWWDFRALGDPPFNEAPWLFSAGVTAQSPVGKVFGLIWLASMVGFFVAAGGLLAGKSWWSTAAILASVLSLVAVIPWWNSITPGIMSKTSAVVVDVAILVALLGPWGSALLSRLGTD